MQAEDSFVRSERPFESHYFASNGTAEIAVPAGRVDVEIMKGFEYRVENRSITVAIGAPANLTVRLEPLKIPKEANSRWVSADLHVHMNYGGAYRNTPKHLIEQAAAENLPIVEDLVVNKEQRIPDIAYFSTKPDAASTPANLLLICCPTTPRTATRRQGACSRQTRQSRIWHMSSKGSWATFTPSTLYPIPLRILL
jgi:hypothetical protein